MGAEGVSVVKAAVYNVIELWNPATIDAAGPGNEGPCVVIAVSGAPVASDLRLKKK